MKTHIITIEGDPYDSIPEFNETNNIAIKTITIREEDETQEYLFIGSIVVILMILIVYLFYRSQKKDNKG
jgi:subtilase family serine protease